jgi:O-antigen/teichoic acid export membrane protein
VTTESTAASPPPDAAEARRAGARGPWTSTVVVFVGNVIARGLGFAFPLVLSRAVGRPEFALVYFFISTGFFVGEIVLAGYPTSLTRFLAAPGNVARGAWMVSSWVAGAPLLVASIGIGFIFAAQADADPALLALVIVGLTIDAYYFAALRGLGRFGLLVGYRIGANLAQIVLLLVAWWLDVATVPIVVGIYAFTYLIPIVAIEVVVGPVHRLLGQAARANLALVRPLTRFAIPALISGTAYAAIMGLDVYWVRLLAPAELADYGAARALAMPMSLVPFAIGVVLMPRVAATHPADQHRLLNQALGATIVASVGAVVGYVVLGATLVSLIYPPSYAAAAGIVPVLAAAVGVLGVYSVLSQWWMGRGRPAGPAVALVIGAIAAGIAAVALVPDLGAIGAAIAMMIGSGSALAILGAATVTGRGAPAVTSDAHVR